ncbi:hypothetical protein T10_5077 [Trichinella papuae]|uniref:Uncharacterized protein n=1 Tax=Trichinella papuae TaxID=268474 RepID=A0A0V1MMB9_9BILA|nr:hypothetical protein T10_5077 [Trichinella papuae]
MLISHIECHPGKQIQYYLQDSATICKLLDVCPRVNVVSSLRDLGQIYPVYSYLLINIIACGGPLMAAFAFLHTCIARLLEQLFQGVATFDLCFILMTMSLTFLDNKSHFTFYLRLCFSFSYSIFTLHKIQQLVGASRYVHTVSTEIGSDEESDVISVCNFEADHGSDQLFEVESDGEVFIYTSVIYTTDNGSDEATTDSEFENEYTSPNGIISKRRPFAPRSRRQDITVEL